MPDAVIEVFAHASVLGAGFAAVELEDDEIEVKFYGVEGDKRIYKSEFSFDEER